MTSDAPVPISKRTLVVAGVTVAGCIVLGLTVGLWGAVGAFIVGAGATFASTKSSAGGTRGGRTSIDPFTVGEPWRNYIKSAQSSQRRLQQTIQATQAGPLHDALVSIGARLDDSLSEAWELAKTGDETNDAIRRIEPTRLRRELGARQAKLAAIPVDGDRTQLEAEVTSLEGQLAAADRLIARSTEIESRLRLTQLRLDELVARANDVGADSTDTYQPQIDALVVELEALHQAAAEVREL